MAVFGEELIDGVLCVGFDLAVQVLVIPFTVGSEVIEGVVVAGQMVSDVGTGCELSTLVKCQGSGTTHPATAHHGGLSRGRLGDLISQRSMLRGELEKPANRVGQFLPIGGLLSLP